MNLNLRPVGPIAPGGIVLQVAGDDDSLWLASPAGVFHFDGAQWRAIMRGIPFWRINAIITAGKSVWVAGMPGGIVRSANNGRSWQRCWTDQTNAPIVTLAASPNYGRDRVLLAGTDGDGILRSTDGGRHWELSNFGLRDFSIFALVTAPVWDRYEYAFAITGGGVYQSPNGGRAWRRADLGDRNVQPLAVAVSPDFIAGQRVFIGCEAGELLVSTDAGRSYNLAADGFEAVTALTFSPQGNLLVGTPQGIGRLETKDVTTLRPTPYALSRLPAPVLSLDTIANKLYAGLTNGLYCSSDDGQSWQPVSGLSARRFVWFLTPGPDLWLAGGPEEGIWRSQNKGQSWQQLWADTPVLAVTATTSQLWVSSPAGVSTSTDAGATWQSVLASEAPITTLAVENETVWAGSHDSQLWRCASGQAWQAVNTLFAGCQMLGIYARPGVLVIAVWDAETGVINLWRSEDDRLKWSNWFSYSSKPATPHLVFTGDAGLEALVGLGGDLHRLTNGMWQRHKLTSPDAPITGLLPLANHILVAVTDQLLASTPNDEWTPVEADINGHPIAALGPSGKQIVIVTVDGQVWVS